MINYVEYAWGALCGITACAPFFYCVHRMLTKELRADLYAARKAEAQMLVAYTRVITETDESETMPSETCGGCGLSKTPIEIVACPGKSCADYINKTGASHSPRKINAGFDRFILKTS